MGVGSGGVWEFRNVASVANYQCPTANWELELDIGNISILATFSTTNNGSRRRSPSQTTNYPLPTYGIILGMKRGVISRRLAKAKKEEARSAESAFKAIDDLLRGSGGGCSGSLERSSRPCTVAQPSDPILRESNALIAAGMF